MGDAAQHALKLPDWFRAAGFYHKQQQRQARHPDAVFKLGKLFGGGGAHTVLIMRHGLWLPLSLCGACRGKGKHSVSQ